MKFLKRRGETSVTIRIFVQDASKTTGEGLTGLTYTSTGMKLGIINSNEANATGYQVSSSGFESIALEGTWVAPTSGKVRFKEISSAWLPGIYELQFENALFAVANSAAILGLLFGATNMAPTPFEIQLDAGEVIADQLVNRNVNGGSNSGRLIKHVFHALRNKWTSLAGVYTVYDTDDATVSWTSATSSDAAAPPITGSDPS